MDNEILSGSLRVFGQNNSMNKLKRLKLDKTFTPCPAADGDELFAPG
jgi:hypothetical protein